METWIVVVEWLARVILALLVILSVWSISIIIERRKYLKEFSVETSFEKLLELIKTTKIDQVDKKSSRFFFSLQSELTRGLSVLGTLGSTTPFIGLLGTVFGIIVAFGELSSGKVGTDSVMFALAEALILTAVGLIVAIPAVIAFNIYSKKVKFITSDIQSRLDEHLSREA